MIIRQATAADYRKTAHCIYLAMDEILHRFIGERNREKALRFLESMTVQSGNQYSYENSLVVEEDAEVIATAVTYDGGELQRLRKPVIQAIETLFQRQCNPEDETQSGEIYIDCIGVEPGFQGRGVGTRLLKELIGMHCIRNHRTLGLLVEKEKEKARQLYLHLGFEAVGEKILAGKRMDHLQLRARSTVPG